MSKTAHHTFETPEQLHAWLHANHASETELWVRIFKKATGQPSVTWDDCVVAAIAWGWIDGQRKSLDETSFLQRLTPRRARSNWSQKKCAACRAADSGRAHATRWPSAGRSRTQRWALGHRLRRQHHHGGAGRLFNSAATRPRCPRFLRHSQTPEPVHHRPPAAQRQAAGTRQKRITELLATWVRRKSLIFAAITKFGVVWAQNQSPTLRWRRRCIQRLDERRPK